MPIIDQVRTHVETGLTDEALGRLISDAVEEVEGRWGTDVERTVTLNGSGCALLSLLRPALTLTSITERGSESSEAQLLVAVDDYALRPGGRLIERLPAGWGWRYWGDVVVVTYVPQPEISLRDRMVVDLVRLAVQHNALENESIGDYKSTSLAYSVAREQILQAGANRRGLRFV